MFQLEPRVPVRMLLDISESMMTGAERRSLKFDYARKLAAALCYVGLVRLDSISCSLLDSWATPLWPAADGTVSSRRRISAR